ncbi:hypothetical protein HU200_029522 [Digitaria exilis]|uniref:Uncharacterized protein n=1 Tax=Digitaria exilis TaxID=1010633 RepID=A0A835BSP5_9POAL|nr:hypothetical protein HU200_029522 [Digitaria exilis]
MADNIPLPPVDGSALWFGFVNPGQETFQFTPGMLPLHTSLLSRNNAGAPENQPAIFQLLIRNNEAKDLVEAIVCNSIREAERDAPNGLLASPSPIFLATRPAQGPSDFRPSPSAVAPSRRSPRDPFLSDYYLSQIGKSPSTNPSRGRLRPAAASASTVEGLRSPCCLAGHWCRHPARRQPTGAHRAPGHQRPSAGSGQPPAGQRAAGQQQVPAGSCKSKMEQVAGEVVMLSMEHKCTTERALNKPIRRLESLDAHARSPDRSVVYVAFGSLTLTGRPFLWVAQPDFTTGLSKAWLHEFQHPVGGSDMIVSWCPQQPPAGGGAPCGGVLPVALRVRKVERVLDDDGIRDKERVDGLRDAESRSMAAWSS